MNPQEKRDFAREYDLHDKIIECNALKAEVAELMEQVERKEFKPDLVLQNLRLNEENDSLKQQVEILKSEARLHDTIVTQLQRGHAAQLKTRDEALSLAVDGLKELNEFTASMLEDMEHYFDNKCVPTSDEVNQCAIADSQLRLIIGKINMLLGREGTT